MGGSFGRPGGYLPDRRGGAAGISGERIPAAVDAIGQGKGQIPGPSRADLLAGVRRAGADREGLQRYGGARRAEGADRHRAGPSGCRVGRLAQPGDGRDEGQERCDRRLADSERASQHGGGGDLGVGAPRRRGRDRLLDPCGNGGGLRRDQGDGGADSARPDHGPRDGGHAPCGRGV